MTDSPKTSFAKNVLMLMASQIIIKLLGLIYRLVIMNIPGFGDVGNGYYSTGYQVYAVLLILSSQGIPGGVSKLVSAKVAVGDYNNADRIFRVSFVVFAIIGAASSVFLFLSADFIAYRILNVPDVRYVMKVLSPAIFLVCCSAVIRGYFAGLGTMKATSTTQALEQFFNCVLTITFVYAMIGREPYIMAAAGNLSTTLACLISFLYLVLFYKRNIKKYWKKGTDTVAKDHASNRALVKVILFTSIPLMIGSLISVVTSFVDTVTISNCIQIAFRDIIHNKEALEQEAMRATGILSKVDTLINLPLAVNLALYSALIPEITSALVKNDRKSASDKISFSLSTTLLLILPCSVGFIVLADPILKMLYPSASDGGLVLQIAAVSMIFMAINHTLQGSLFGIGKLYTPALALLCGCGVKIVLNLVLITNPKIGMYGACISTLVCELITFAIIGRVLRKNIKFRLDKKNGLLKPLLSSVVMGACIILLRLFMEQYIPNLVMTLICIFAGMLIYAFLIAKTNAVGKAELISLPKGDKLYRLLVKLHFYREDS